MSTSDLDLLAGDAARALNTLVTCCSVAGTNGRQALRSAGVTNGRHAALTARAEPPATTE